MYIGTIAEGVYEGATVECESPRLIFGRYEYEFVEGAWLPVAEVS